MMTDGRRDGPEEFYQPKDFEMETALYETTIDKPLNSFSDVNKSLCSQRLVLTGRTLEPSQLTSDSGSQMLCY